MTPIANLIRHMLAKGIDIEAILIAVEAIEFEREEKQQLSREQNRIRQQNHRARNGDTRDTRDTENIQQNQPPRTRDKRDTVNAIVSKKEDIKESKQTLSVKGSVCPSDFQPNEGDYKVGNDYGHSHAQVDGQCTQMVEWSQANRNRAVARKSDWHLTLRGFLRRHGKPAQSQSDQQGMSAEEYHRKYSGATEEEISEWKSRVTRKANGKGHTETLDGSGTESSDYESEFLQTR